jgi:glycosyltransferase involved in cell wall biosynthesis
MSEVFGQKKQNPAEPSVLRAAPPADPRNRVGADRSYAAWVRQFDTVGPAERIVLRRDMRALRRHPLISVVVPVYNPNFAHLSSTIESVRAQLYQNWELCIADDASTDALVIPTLKQYATTDSRIKVTFRESRGHIAACSNSALELATGEWIALLDQDDLLAEHALAVVAATIAEYPDAGLIYSDEDKIDESGSHCCPFFKPDWNAELLLGQNYISHLGIYRCALLREIGGFREGYDGAQDYDVALRCAEKLQPAQIRHIPRVLYHWRMVEGSVAAVAEAKPYAPKAARRAIADHLQRRKVQGGEVLPCPENQQWHRVIYHLPPRTPLVSVIVPTRDQLPLLQRCLTSIREKADYAPIEIVIVDNGSTKPETYAFLHDLAQEPNIHILTETGEFNFSRLINCGARAAHGEILAFVNNDIETEKSGWLREMVSHALRPEVGAVGARLWYPDGTLQHGGVVLGLHGVASHAFQRFPPQPISPMNRTFVLSQNYSAVTAACMVLRKTVFDELCGFDENLPSNFNDVDFCLRVREAGLQIVWTPYADLIHHESASRGRNFGSAWRAQVIREADYMQAKWGEQLRRDPFYNPNLSHSLVFTLAWPPRNQPLRDSLKSAAEEVFSGSF